MLGLRNERAKAADCQQGSSVDDSAGAATGATALPTPALACPGVTAGALKIVRDPREHVPPFDNEHEALLGWYMPKAFGMVQGAEDVS